jgi:hypothetical protein
MMNLFAFTALSGSYPGYVSINRNEDGDIAVTVREAPKVFEGVHVCANKGDEAPGRCTPGGPTCNNYCNLAPQIGPMQNHPLPATHTTEGKQATFVVPADVWSKAFP